VFPHERGDNNIQGRICREEECFDRHWLKRPVAAFGLWISASAQTATATIKGVVSDGAGKAVPGAAVTLSSVSSGLKRAFTTDEHGQYTFTLVEPGAYALEVRAQGFKSQIQPNVKLEVGQNAELNVSLAIGDIQETVNITAAETIALDSGASSLGGVVDRQRVTLCR